jgi:TRAP-type C4-dicarboxylate transport system permease small subunit
MTSLPVDHNDSGSNRSGVVAAIDTDPVLVVLDRWTGFCNRVIVILAALALIAACLILSYSVLTRSLLKTATYWQDEAAVFLLVGATFMTSGYVQSRRGHIGIEALVGLLSPRVNHIRQVLVDLASLAFCMFFAWKSWTLTDEAWTDGQVSNSMWSPPLAIPYGLMSLGMTLLCVQILLQVWGALYRMPRS